MRNKREWDYANSPEAEDNAGGLVGAPTVQGTISLSDAILERLRGLRDGYAELNQRQTTFRRRLLGELEADQSEPDEKRLSPPAFVDGANEVIGQLQDLLDECHRTMSEIERF